jgi:diamine N-acetyltransferase
MAIAIRKAQPEDAAVIALLGRLTFRETFGALFEGQESALQAYLHQTFSVAKITSSIAKPENHYWLALLDDLPVGYAKLKAPSLTACIDDPAPAQLQKIYVLSEFLAHSIGHALLETVMLAAMAAKAKVMWLTVLDTNDRAIGFYARHGWARIGNTTFAIGAQEFSFHVMRTDVRAV